MKALAPAASLVMAALSVACSHHHGARVNGAALPPPPGQLVRHSHRLWLALDEQTSDQQCARAPKTRRPVCFLAVRDTLEQSLTRVLWPSFPEVRVRQKQDDLLPGDYVLLVDVDLGVQEPDAAGPGYSALARARWRLVRDGIPIATEELSSRSRAEFPYGSKLAAGAGEVLDAVATHIGHTLATLPESKPVAPIPLPKVVVAKRGGLLAIPQAPRTARR